MVIIIIRTVQQLHVEFCFLNTLFDLYLNTRKLSHKCVLFIFVFYSAN